MTDELCNPHPLGIIEKQKHKPKKKTKMKIDKHTDANITIDNCKKINNDEFLKFNQST